MNLDPHSCLRAVRTRDRRFDGRFFVAVSSTGIYCRPICPVRPAKPEHMNFFPSAAAAEAQGYRPCLRCRPERAPGLAPVDSVSRLVAAAIAGIEEHALSSTGVADLADTLGVSDRHLRRATRAELGVSPIELAQTQRLLLAKRLLKDTALSQTEIAFASGFGSVRRFNALFKARYGLAPSTVRGRAADQDALVCELEFRPPYAWSQLLEYLRVRAIPGVESVDASHYRRTAAIGGHQGWVAVSLGEAQRTLRVEISPGLAPAIGAVIHRIKRQFDVSADPAAVTAHLQNDSILGVAVRRWPGLRSPGAFEGFEVAVRAILGQQVTLRAASTLAGRWARAFGEPIATPFPGLDRLTPTADAVTRASPESFAALGIIRARANAILVLAEKIAARHIRLSFVANVDHEIDALCSVPGIGTWTAQYIAMRALQWPDAFPCGDLHLRRISGLSGRQLQLRAEAWRPWRAYASHYLWQSVGGES